MKNAARHYLIVGLYVLTVLSLCSAVQMARAVVTDAQQLSATSESGMVTLEISMRNVLHAQNQHQHRHLLHYRRLIRRQHLVR
jgi:hypothetical protein